MARKFLAALVCVLALAGCVGGSDDMEAATEGPAWNHDPADATRWIVLPDILVKRQYSVERLHELIAGFPGYDAYAHNNRPTQPLDGRQIQRSN